MPSFVATRLHWKYPVPPPPLTAAAAVDVAEEEERIGGDAPAGLSEDCNAAGADAGDVGGQVTVLLQPLIPYKTLPQLIRGQTEVK